MKLLLAGLTGQLGAGLRAAQPGGLTALIRSGSSRGLPAGEAEATITGDVRRPMWGLDDDALSRSAAEVEAVVNLAADTNWTAGARDLFATNALGAMHGYALARELSRRSGRPVPYVYASSVYVAGGAVGEIPERPAPVAGDRTPYERSKWLAERRLLHAASEPGAPPLLVARLPALVGDSQTGRTLRRNSLYLLADRWAELPGNLLPAMRHARVDALPRDVAAAVLLRAVHAFVDRAPTEPVICHLGLGESAPSLRGLVEAAATGVQRPRGEPRLVTVSARTLLWCSLNADRFLPLTSSAQNALIGLRYIGLDRTFSRPVLAGLLDDDLPAVTVETLARLIFGARPQRRDSPAVNGSMARFPG